MLIIYALLLFVLIAALVAVETRNLLSAVICVGAIGFGGSLLFLFLQAPDIAITQIVVEVLGLIILIRATLSRDMTFISGDKEFFATVVSVVVLLILFLAGAQAFSTLPEFGEPAFIAAPMRPAGATASASILADGLADTGAANLVTSVILDYRAYDTLGEATVLFAAIMGVTVVLRERARAKQEVLPS
ncbi:hydrogen gas-evolving membrane-bound hydrogenase subunit E [Planctomycetota bacterium]